MKNIKLLIFAATLLLIGIINGCESDNKDYPVTIGFSNASALDSVFVGDSYVLKGTIIANGPIKTVQFYSNFVLSYTKDSVAVTKQDSVEIAGTRITNVKGDTCNFSISIPNITEQTTVRVVATQNDGHQTSALYTIESELIPYPNRWAGGWLAPVYGNFYSLSNDSNWGFSIEANHAERIPLCDFYFGDYKVGATDLDSLKHNPTVPGFADNVIGTQFAKTTFTATQFDAMRTDALFKTMTPKLTYVDFKAGDVIVFKTKAGKLGLMKIISADVSENYNFSVIIQQ